MVDDEKPLIVKLFFLSFSFTPNRPKLSGFYLTMSFSNFFFFPFALFKRQFCFGKGNLGYVITSNEKDYWLSLYFGEINTPKPLCNNFILTRTAIQ